MSKISVSVAATGFALLMVAAANPVQGQTSSQAQIEAQALAQPLSRVRIVRLSEVKGAVQLDRGAGRGYESAIANMPAVEGNRLKTAMGVAEVEFEDNSTLRVGPNSEVDFILLGRTAEGNTVSKVRVVGGIAYVSLVKSSRKTANVFDLTFGSQREIALQPDTHVRLDIEGQQAKLAVLGGSVDVSGANGAVDVARKHTATFALEGDADATVAKGVEADSLLDAWDKQLDQYHSRVASLSRFGGVPYSYGVTDMMYYGAFEDAGGCGEMWRPYFASAAWSPYSNGTWAYYAGAGYSWVSPYPWGWTPYHYGSWSFCPGTGWGWMPGGSWMGIQNIAAAATPAKPVMGTVARRRNPVLPRPPGVGGASLVRINQTALVSSGLSARGSSTFVFVKDSAGLGIPRDELGGLKGFSRHADQRGLAATPIYRSMPSNAGSEMRAGRMSPAPVEVHRGYAPSYGRMSSTRSDSNVGYAGNSSMPASSAPSSAPMPSAAPSMPSAPAMGGARAGGRGAH